MARQPLVRTISRAKAHKANLRFGVGAILKRPASSQLLGQCITKWSYVESEMAVVLGTLLKTESAGMLSVFQILRRSSAQRDAISEAARIGLCSHHQELLKAILLVHRCIEADRNDLSHGIIGECDEISDGILWLESTEQMLLRLRFHLEPGFEFGDEEKATLAEKCFVYRNSDLQRVSDDINELWNIWFDFMHICHYPDATEE